MNEKVVIVGAGAPGCAAAKYLLDNGFTDFVILQYDDSEVPDMQRCNVREHTTGMNFDLLLKDNRSFTFIRSNGFSVTNDSFKCVIDVMRSIEKDNDKQILNEYLSNCDIDDGLRNEFKKCLNHFFPSFNIHETNEINSWINKTKKIEEINYLKTLNDSNELISFKCSDKSEYFAKYAICAINFINLKEIHEKFFYPQLSMDKQKALISLTAINEFPEIIIEFENAFWLENFYGFGLLWNEIDVNHINKIINIKWITEIYFVQIDENQLNSLQIRLNGIDEIRSMNEMTENEIIYGIKFLFNLFKPGWKLTNILSVKKSKWFTNNENKNYTYNGININQIISEPIWNKNGLPIIQFIDNMNSMNCGKFVAKRLLNYLRNQNLPTHIISSIEIDKKIIKHFDVIILGAGLAGLGAATAINQSLLKEKISYKILEAEHRPGGRANTLNMNDFSHHRRIVDNVIDMDRKKLFEKDKTIDSGAQWLHGKYNFLHEFAEKYELLSNKQSEEGLGAFLYENFIEIDYYLVKKIDFIFGQLLTECELYAQKNVLEPPKSVGEFLQKRFNQYIDKIDDLTEKCIARDLFDWHWRFQVIDNSCLSLDQLSAKYWGKYSFNGESCQAHYNFKNGFTSIINKLIDELPMNVINYEKEVQQILFNAIKINENSKVIVKCSDDSVYAANTVLVTFSLGVLKANKDKLFVPKLPYDTQQAIDNLGYETINKIFMQFETAWWGDLGGIQLIFEQNDNESKHWTKYLTGFDVVSPGAPNTLLGWVGGKGAIEMELLTDHEIIEDCMKLLSKFMKIDIPFPIRYFCSRWNSNPYFCGAYSFISTECDQSDSPYTQLTHPLTLQEIDATVSNTNESTNNNNNVPVLMFAGEACHDKYFSTAHGAFLSGMEQVQKLLSILN